MHPTVLGLVLLPCSVAWAWRPVRLLELAFVAAVFEAAAALVIGGFGLQPGMVPALLLILYVAMQYALGMRYDGEGPALAALLPLLALLGYALMSILVLPDAFAGQVLVAPQKLDLYSPWLVPLSFTFGNVTQTMYLAVNTATAIAAALVVTRAAIPYARIVEAYLVSGYVVVALVFWQLAARTVGVFFPKEILYSNPGWTVVDQSIGQVPRLQGPFSEPAGLALYLSGLCFCCLLLVARGYRLRRPGLLLALAAGAMLLSTSSTGIACLIAEVPASILVVGWRTGRRATARLVRMLSVIVLTACVALTPLIILRPAYLDAASLVVTGTMSKEDSESYINRTALDAAALETVAPTYGLGVGWGSFRSSSLFPGLLANGGIPGIAALVWLAIALACLVSRAVKAAPRHPGRVMIDAFSAALCGQLAAALLSSPMITSPGFFLELGCVVGAASRMVACPAAWAARRRRGLAHAGGPASPGLAAARGRGAGG